MRYSAAISCIFLFFGAAPSVEASPPAPTASYAATPSTTSDVYTASRDVYARLLVNVSYPGERPIASSECPEGSLLKQALDFHDDKTYSLAISIKAPDASTQAFSPMSVSVTHGWHGSCQMVLNAVTYISPMTRLSDATGGYTITPVFLKTDKPSAAIEQDTTVLLKVAGQVATVPAPVASTISSAITSMVSDFSSATEVTLGDQLFFDPRFATAIKPWTDRLTVDGKVTTVTVTAKLQNVASIFDTQAGSLSDVKITSYQQVLNTTILPSLLKNMDGPGTATSLITYTADAATKDFWATKTVADAEKKCDAVMTKFANAGMSQTDQAILMWAVARSHPQLGSQPAIEHMACLSDTSNLLKVVGINLRAASTGAAPHDPTVLEMGWVTAQDDLIFNFFRSGSLDTRESAATSIFSQPVALSDDEGVTVPNATNKVLNAQDWLVRQQTWNTNAGGGKILPLFDRLGCYRYAPADSKAGTQASLYAVGTVDTNTLGRPVGEFFIQMKFGQARKGINPTISSITISRHVDQPIVDLIKAGRASCGGDPPYVPAILFGG